MLDNKDFNKNLIEKIKEEKIVPKARWRFLLKNSLIWALGIFSLLLGGVAASLIYYVSQNENGFAYRRAGGSLIQSLFLVVPLFWIICLILLIASVYYYIKHTKKGYKYSNKQIALIVGVLVIFLGSMLSVSRLDAKMEDLMSRRAPYYDKFVNPSINFWSKPEEGRLVGIIIEKASSDKYYLIDKSKDEWVVKTTNIPELEMAPGRPVRLIGVKSDDYEFTASEAMPMGPGRGFLKRPLQCPKDNIKDCPSHKIKNNKFEKNKRFIDEEFKKIQSKDSRDK